jgi:hypothetical protein
MLGLSPSPMTLTLTTPTGSATVALRPDLAEYLLSATTVNPADWRIRDLVTSAWAAAQQLKG